MRVDVCIILRTFNSNAMSMSVLQAERVTVWVGKREGWGDVGMFLMFRHTFMAFMANVEWESFCVIQ